MILNYYLIITAFIVLLLAIEYLWLHRVLNKIPLRILINGTRGKTTTVRILHKLLNQSGRVTCSKTTGDEPLLLLPDGGSRLMKRFAPANIRENISVLMKWEKYRPDAVVMECMALQPETQHILSGRIFKPTYLAVTNVKVDHQEVMGMSRQEIIRSISKSFYGHCRHFLPEQLADAFTHTKNKNSQYYSYPNIPHPLQLHHIPDDIIAESWGLIRTLSDSLEINPELADSIFREEWLQTDASIKLSFSRLNFHFYNLFSVNDGETAGKIVHKIRESTGTPVQEIVLLNTRSDRPLRSVQFYTFLKENFPLADIWITGTGQFILRRLFRENPNKNKIYYINGNNKLAELLRRGFDHPRCIYGMANHKGTESLLSQLRAGL